MELWAVTSHRRYVFGRQGMGLSAWRSWGRLSSFWRRYSVFGNSHQFPRESEKAAWPDRRGKPPVSTSILGHLIGLPRASRTMRRGSENGLAAVVDNGESVNLSLWVRPELEW